MLSQVNLENRGSNQDSCSPRLFLWLCHGQYWSAHHLFLFLKPQQLREAGFTWEQARPAQIRRYIMCRHFCIPHPITTDSVKFALLFKNFPKVWIYRELSCYTQLQCLYSSLFITGFLSMIFAFQLPQHKLWWPTKKNSFSYLSLHTCWC